MGKRQQHDCCSQALANPLGPARLGRAEVENTIHEAAAHFTRGSLVVEELTRYATADLGKVAHRHADPMTSPRTISTAIET